MTLCPIALAVHCTGCPVVKVCPAKRVLGDYATHVPATSAASAKVAGGVAPPKADHADEIPAFTMENESKLKTKGGE